MLKAFTAGPAFGDCPGDAWPRPRHWQRVESIRVPAEDGDIALVWALRELGFGAPDFEPVGFCARHIVRVWCV